MLLGDDGNGGTRVGSDGIPRVLFLPMAAHLSAAARAAAAAAVWVASPINSHKNKSQVLWFDTQTWRVNKTQKTKRQRSSP